MKSIKPKNYEEQIHNYFPLQTFLEKPITVDSLLQISGRKTESLNGMWKFCIDQYITSIRAGWYKEPKESKGFPLPLDYDFEGWEDVTVPSCWNTQNETYFLYEGYGIYTRTFSCARTRDERIFLHFGAVQYRAFVFLNKEFLGVHSGGSTPFSVEVTETINDNENRLFVLVENLRSPDRVPMDNTDWFNYGGIYRDVSLVRVPKAFIQTYKIGLVPDGTYSTIEVEVNTMNASDGESVQVSIPDLKVLLHIPLTNNHGIIQCKSPIELWSPDSPRLYQVELDLGDDKIKEKIGFREISVQGQDVLLNGLPLFFRGVSCHEDSVTGGKYISTEERINDFSIAKEMGCNYLRLAHYPHSQDAAGLADEIGLMLWEEIPVYWAIDFGNPETYHDAENQLKELIVRDQNRASVIIWSVGNENPDTDARYNFMKNLALKAKSLDKSRLVSAACLVNPVDNRIEDRLSEVLDIIGINEYYGWYDPDYSRLPAFFQNSNPDKPVFICEFGGGALAGHRGSISDFFTEDRQEHIYREQLKILLHTPYVKGLSPWILFDFRCPRRTNRYQKGYNRKGLLSEDKKTKKAAYYVLQAAYMKLKELTTQ